jgi:hypothetical protein
VLELGIDDFQLGMFQLLNMKMDVENKLVWSLPYHLLNNF